ncbi:KCTD1_15 [Mytilus coruscus]|uniref:KCTD1_15 n=1 Tax=Mytilus coruscus TaxID=42192 RepID=A0A6J8DGC3_MYTCO|nr:KCTD1_15 [Mytilus coruscus]
MVHHQALRRKNFNDMMKAISKDAGLTKLYTNHCVLATTINVLAQSGVSEKDTNVREERREETLKPGEKRKYDNKYQERNCIINALQKSKSRIVKNLKKFATKLQKEQIDEPVDPLFLIRRKGSTIIKAFGYGEMIERFTECSPITDTPPYSHRRKLPTMPEVTPDQEVILLTPEKDTFNFGVGSGRNLAKEQKEILDQMQINVTSADVNVCYGYGELRDRFINGKPLTDYNSQKVEFLTPEKDPFSFSRSSRKTLAERQKDQLDNLPIRITPDEVYVKVKVILHLINIILRL